MKYLYILQNYLMSNKLKLYIIKNYLSLCKINLNGYLKCIEINLSVSIWKNLMKNTSKCNEV